MIGWPTLFSLVNLWALLAWAVLLIAPRRPVVLSALLYGGVAMLCLVYAVLLALLLTGAVAAGGPVGGADFTTIAGVQRIFQSEGGTVVGWTHYLAFDLFAGLWIARDADRRGVGRIVQAPILFLTFVAGPVGLFLWFVTRSALTR